MWWDTIAFVLIAVVAFVMSATARQIHRLETRVSELESDIKSREGDHK